MLIFYLLLLEMNNENTDTVVASIDDDDDENIMNNDEIYSFDEYNVLLKFFGNKRALLDYLRINGKFIKIKIYPSNNMDLLTSNDPSFQHFVIPLIQEGGLKKLNKTLVRRSKVRTQRRKQRRTRRNK